MSPEIDFYRTHSPITDPVSQAALFDALPDDLPGIAEAVRGLVYHFSADEQFFHWKVPQERLPEIDTRMVETILATLTAMDDRPLTEAREPHNRIVGCCRDFTALFVAALRHKGIPARSRYGFGAYLIPEYFIDHVIAEVWDADQQRWRMFDPEMPPAAFNFDVTDITRDRFVLGGDAWKRCRAGEGDPERYGLGPDGPAQGWDFIIARMLLDFAALNKREMLCWENWGLSTTAYDDMTADDLALLDDVAEMTTAVPVPFDKLRTLYANESRLNLNGEIISYSPAYPFHALPREVRLTFA